jgi:hypothetical protein
MAEDQINFYEKELDSKFCIFQPDRYEWTGYEVDSPIVQMKYFLKRVRNIGTGLGHDRALINGLMPVIITDEDLQCSVTGKKKTQKIPYDKKRLIIGKLLQVLFFSSDTKSKGSSINYAIFGN